MIIRLKSDQRHYLICFKSPNIILTED